MKSLRLSQLILIPIFYFSLMPVSGQGTIVQFRGPDRNGIYPDVNLLKKWPAGGPTLLLKLSGIGEGFSSPVVSNKTIYVTGLKDTMDVVSAFDMKGKLIWQKPIGKAWLEAHSESRNTPTIQGNRLYIESGIGEVVCLDATTGKQIWRRNPARDFQGKLSYWGPAECLLLVDDKVITIVGGDNTAVVALDKTNGKTLWKSPSVNDAKAYSSPLLIDRNGQKLIIAELERKIIGVDPADGKVFWSYSLISPNPDSLTWLNHTNIPAYRNGEILVTRGYNINAIMLSLSPDGKKVSLKWQNPLLDTHIGGVIEYKGFIYGSTWTSNSGGNWACLNWDNGKVMYDTQWFTKGSILLADGLLYCMEEKNGNVALVQPDPSGFKVISSFRVKEGAGPWFSHPTIYGGKLLIRHGDFLMVYDISNH